MQYIVRKKGHRLFPIVTLALLGLVLGLGLMSTGAVHNEGLLELDGNVAYDDGFGFDPGTNNCPFSVAGPDNGDPDDCISNAAAFDWADVCDRTSGGALAGYITEAASQPAVLAGSDVICQPDFVIGATDDISYHTGSDKDYQEIFDGSSADWGCQTSANATSKADILNTYFIVTSVEEADGPHQVVYIGAERDSQHGSAFNGYWILQSGISVPGATTTAGQLDCTPNAPLDFSGQHVCGDVLILFNYETGGRIGRVAAYQWQPGFGTSNVGCDGVASTGDECPFPNSAESHDPLCLIVDVANGDCRLVSASDDLCGRVNGEPECQPTRRKPQPCSGPGSFSRPWAPDSTVAPTTFSEAGIDLTALGLNLCVGAFMAETRSSPSVHATLKDYVLATGLTECGVGLTKTPSVTDVCEGRDAPVTYTYVVSSGSPTALTVNLSDDNGTPGDPSDDIDVDGGAGFSLAGGASQTFTITQIINTSTTNTVTASATAGGFSATATAEATVAAYICTIDVTKVCLGDTTTVTFSGTVTNTGTALLKNVTVTDDQAGSVFGPADLVPGASANYSGSFVPASLPSMNTVIAAGAAFTPDGQGDLDFSPSAAASATCGPLPQ